MEEFRTVNKFPNYQVSNFGNVMHIKRNKLLKQSIHIKGYYNVWLRNTDTDERSFARVHRLVAEAFIPNPNNKLYIDHIDGDRQNNNINNLRWASMTENNQNRQIAINNTSGIKGVCYDKTNKKYIAYIMCHGIRKNLGRYESIQEAKQIRQEVANTLFGAFTHRCEKIVNETHIQLDVILNKTKTQLNEIEIHLKEINE